MRYLIGLILLVTSLQSYSQVLNATGNVEQPLSTYRLMTDKWYACDSAILYKDQIIHSQDTIIGNKNAQIASLNQLVIQKDSTINGLQIIAEEAIKKQKKPFANPLPWICFSVGSILTALILH